MQNVSVERFHSTLIKHIKLLNIQDEIKNKTILKKLRMQYQLIIILYTRLLNSSFLKLYQDTYIVVHLIWSLFGRQSINKYVINHKNKMKVLYSNINKNIPKTKNKNKLHEVFVNKKFL